MDGGFLGMTMRIDENKRVADRAPMARAGFGFA